MLVPIRYNADLRQEVQGYLALGWTDTEIAHVKGKVPATIAAWRRAWKLPPAPKARKDLCQAFCQTYGPRALQELRQMCRRQATFREIGAHFGFSRAYAHYVVKAFYPRRRRRPIAQER